MLAQRNRRGAVAGIIAAVIVLLLVAGGIWYFVSKPFHTHVNEGMRQATQWTPENIRKDPAGYLTWAISQVNVTRDKLKAAQLSLETQKIEIEKKLEEKSAEKSGCETLLEELKDKYKTADAKNQWPVKIRNVTFEQPQDLKDKIVLVARSLTSAKSLTEAYTKAEGRVGQRLGEVNAQLTDVESLKTKLVTDLETAKVQQTFEGIEGVSSNFDKIVSSSKALSKTAERNTSVSEMLKPSGTDEEFEKIMGKKNTPAGKGTPGEQ